VRVEAAGSHHPPKTRQLIGMPRKKYPGSENMKCTIFAFVLFALSLIVVPTVRSASTVVRQDVAIAGYRTSEIRINKPIDEIIEWKGAWLCVEPQWRAR
jgi:hypothetical protein